MERTQVIIDDNKRAITIRTATGTFTQSGISKPIIDLLNNLEEEIEQLKKRNKELEDGFKATTEELCEYAEENEKLKQSLENRLKYSDELDEKISRIDKALYWLSENTHYTSLKTNMLVQDENANFLELKDILQGDDKE